MREYLALCAQFSLPCPRKTSKLSWKKLVKSAIVEDNKIYLLEQIQTKYSKLDYEQLSGEDYSTKEYLKTMRMSNARLRFRIRTKMVQNVAFNFSSDPQFVNRLWRCVHCGCMDSISHVLNCEGYKYLREGKDMEDDLDLVNYFRNVISLRDKTSDL